MKFIDITGQRFGKLTVIKYLGGSKWECKCDCGKTAAVLGYNLKNGTSKSCGCQRQNSLIAKADKEMIDNKFGRLTVLQFDHVKNGHRYYKCKCDCGNETIVDKYYLKHGQIVSCGCRLAEQQEELSVIPRLSKSNLSILKEEPNANNQLNIRGVYYNKTLKLYVAKIQYKKKEYVLKYSRNLSECIKARKEAEMHVQKDFLAWLEEYKAEQKANEEFDQS